MIRVPITEDPAASLLRLFKRNVRLTRDDGSPAQVLVLREKTVRKIDASVDAHVTVGLNAPGKVVPITLGDTRRKRLVALNVEGWVFDRPGVDSGYMRAKLREELLRVIRERKFTPHYAVYDFGGVNSEGLHDCCVLETVSELPPPTAEWSEVGDEDYEKLWVSDDERLVFSTVEIGYYACLLFAFRLDTRGEYAPHEENVAKLTVTFEGFGSFPGGNGVKIWLWNHVSQAWTVSTSGSGTGDETLTLTVSGDLVTKFIDEQDGVGIIYVLAVSLSPSDGETPAAVYCDYIKCALTVQTFTLLKLSSFPQDVDEVKEVKPPVRRTSFTVTGVMFES